MNNKFYSPLRYPGGKGKLAEFIGQLIADNDMTGCTYVEPYVGGGSVALFLLFDGFANKIIINDKDRSIYAFWHSVLNYPDEFCRLINDTHITMENWYLMKKIQTDQSDSELLQLGFSTFFLNRTNRSGILKGGVIGGYDQTGNYLMDSRFNKASLIQRIQTIASKSDAIDLYNSDAVDLVKSLRTTLPQNTLFYFDPPYYVKGKGLYLNYYNDQDHQDIADEINLIDKQKFLVSYDHVPFISNLYKSYRTCPITLNYSACKVGKGEELLVFSDNLIIPYQFEIEKASYSQSLNTELIV